MNENLELMRATIQRIFNCTATHVGAVPVDYRIELPSKIPVFLRWFASPDKLGWKGVVEIFDLIGHPSANRCYAWDYSSRHESKVAIVLGLSPVISAETAVRAKLREAIDSPELKQLIDAAPPAQHRRSVPFHGFVTLFALILSATSAYRATHGDPYPRQYMFVAVLALAFALIHASIAYRAHRRHQPAGRNP